MKHKKLTFFALFVSILLFSTTLAYAFKEGNVPQQYIEKQHVVICSNDYANGYYEPYVLNGNNYPVKVTFDLYCLYGENGTKKYIGRYSKTLPAQSGYEYFPKRRHNQDCYCAFPTNISIVPQ